MQSKDEEGYWTATVSQMKIIMACSNSVERCHCPLHDERDLATDEDWERYQTVYANHPGAVAAPTAGLHFTPELLERCTRNRESGIAKVTLHVGIGTFKPISTETLEEHKMHSRMV